jgi:hypothetical protein
VSFGHTLKARRYAISLAPGEQLPGVAQPKPPRPAGSTGPHLRQQLAAQHAAKSARISDGVGIAVIVKIREGVGAAGGPLPDPLGPPDQVGAAVGPAVQMVPRPVQSRT